MLFCIGICLCTIPLDVREPTQQSFRPVASTWHSVIVIVFVTMLSIIFWLGFEQKSGKLNDFATEQMASSTFAGWEFPPSLLLSVNPFLVVVLAPIFAMSWRMLASVGRDPHPLTKMGFGLVALGLGFGALEFGVGSSPSGHVAIHWFLVLYTLHTIGELLLEPIGTDFVARNSPDGCRAFLLAIWDGTSAIALYGGSLVAIYFGASLWTALGVSAVASGVVLLGTTPTLRSFVR